MVFTSFLQPLVTTIDKATRGSRARLKESLTWLVIPVQAGTREVQGTGFRPAPE